MKAYICSAAGIFGGAVAWLFGGWSAAIIVLLICMAIDYITGLIVAGVFHKSPKSASGGLESKAGWKGLIRKVVTLMIVVIAHLIDKLLGANYLRDAVVIAFCLNEIISIIENAGLMGIPIPKALKRAIDVLQEKYDDVEPEDDDTVGNVRICSIGYSKCANKDCTQEFCPLPLSDRSKCLNYQKGDKQ